MIFWKLKLLYICLIIWFLELRFYECCHSCLNIFIYCKFFSWYLLLCYKLSRYTYNGNTYKVNLIEDLPFLLGNLSIYCPNVLYERETHNLLLMKHGQKLFILLLFLVAKLLFHSKCHWGKFKGNHDFFQLFKIDGMLFYIDRRLIFLWRFSITYFDR